MPLADPRNALIDCRGVWCAICLEYGTPRQPLGPAFRGFEKELADNDRIHAFLVFPFLADVLVHQQCLESRPQVGGIATTIAAFMKSLAGKPSARLDQAARELHEEGLYPLSLELKEHLFNQQSNRMQPAERATTLARLIAAASGVRRFRPGHTLPEGSDQSPEVILHRSSYAVNRGQDTVARDGLQHAQEQRAGLPTRIRESSDASYEMRRAQILRSLEAGREAIALTANSPYMSNTAFLLNGHLFAPARRTLARTYLEAVLLDPKASWLYIAEALFGLALLMERRQTREIYQKLVAAQYILSMLNLQGLPHPDLHPFLRDAAITPAGVLVDDPAFANMAGEHPTALRREAIIETGLQRELFEALFHIGAVDKRSTAPFAPGKARVLVLGADSNAMHTLREMQEALRRAGYRSWIAMDQPDIQQETIAEKVLRLAASSRFIVVEVSKAAGQLMELDALAKCGYTLIALFNGERPATALASELDLVFAGVRSWKYESSTLFETMQLGCAWAEEWLLAKERALNERQVWRHTAGTLLR